MKLLELKGERTKAGIKQKEMAKALDISVDSYSRKERNIVRFTDPEKEKISEILGFNIDQFMKCFFYGLKLPNGNNSDKND